MQKERSKEDMSGACFICLLALWCPKDMVLRTPISFLLWKIYCKSTIY